MVNQNGSCFLCPGLIQDGLAEWREASDGIWWGSAGDLMCSSLTTNNIISPCPFSTTTTSCLVTLSHSFLLHHLAKTLHFRIFNPSGSRFLSRRKIMPWRSMRSKLNLRSRLVFLLLKEKTLFMIRLCSVPRTFETRVSVRKGEPGAVRSLILLFEVCFLNH